MYLIKGTKLGGIHNFDNNFISRNFALKFTSHQTYLDDIHTFL